METTCRMPRAGVQCRRMTSSIALCRTATFSTTLASSRLARFPRRFRISSPPARYGARGSWRMLPPPIARTPHATRTLPRDPSFTFWDSSAICMSTGPSTDLREFCLERVAMLSRIFTDARALARKRGSGRSTLVRPLVSSRWVSTGRCARPVGTLRAGYPLSSEPTHPNWSNGLISFRRHFCAADVQICGSHPHALPKQLRAGQMWYRISDPYACAVGISV